MPDRQHISATVLKLAEIAAANIITPSTGSKDAKSGDERWADRVWRRTRALLDTMPNDLGLILGIKDTRDDELDEPPSAVFSAPQDAVMAIFEVVGHRMTPQHRTIIAASSHRDRTEIMVSTKSLDEMFTLLTDDVLDSVTHNPDRVFAAVEILKLAMAQALEREEAKTNA